MIPFQQLDPRHKSLEVLRWIAVLPSAALGDFLADLLLRPARSVTLIGWLLPYLFAPVAFVVTGSSVAPRGRVATGVTLAIVSGAWSLLKHVVGQHLAGNRVGATNYEHCALELAGALAGVVLVIANRARALKAPAARSPGHDAAGHAE